METVGKWVWALTVGVLVTCWLAPSVAKVPPVAKTSQGGSITGKAVWQRRPLPSGWLLAITLTEEHGGQDKPVTFHATAGKQGTFTLGHIRPGTYRVSLWLTVSATVLGDRGRFGGAEFRGNLRKPVVVRAGKRVDVGTIRLLAFCIQ